MTNNIQIGEFIEAMKTYLKTFVEFQQNEDIGTGEKCDTSGFIPRNEQAWAKAFVNYINPVLNGETA